MVILSILSCAYDYMDTVHERTVFPSEDAIDRLGVFDESLPETPCDPSANRGYKVPTRKLPNIIVRFSALFDKTLRLVVKDLGKHAEISNARIKEVLAWKPRTLKEMVVTMAESMIEYGVV